MQMSTAWTALEQASAAFPPDINALKAAIRQARPYEELKGYVSGAESLLASLERGERQPAASVARQPSAERQASASAVKQPKLKQALANSDAAQLKQTVSQRKAVQQGGAEAEAENRKDSPVKAQQPAETKQEAEAVPQPESAQPESPQQAEPELPDSPQRAEASQTPTTEQADSAGPSGMPQASTPAVQQEKPQGEAVRIASAQAEAPNLQHAQTPELNTDILAPHQQPPAAAQLTGNRSAIAHPHQDPQGDAKSQDTDKASVAAPGDPQQTGTVSAADAAPERASAAGSRDQEAADGPSPKGGVADEQGEPAGSEAAMTAEQLRLARLQCFRCREYGREVRGCHLLDPKKRYPCQQIGHMASACPNKTRPLRKIVTVPEAVIRAIPQNQGAQSKAAPMTLPSTLTELPSVSRTLPLIRTRSSKQPLSLAQLAPVNTTLPLPQTSYSGVDAVPLTELQDRNEVHAAPADAAEHQAGPTQQDEQQQVDKSRVSGLQDHQSKALAGSTADQQQDGTPQEAAATAAPAAVPSPAAATAAPVATSAHAASTAAPAAAPAPAASTAAPVVAPPPAAATAAPAAAPAPAATPPSVAGSMQDFLSFLLPAENPSTSASPSAVAQPALVAQPQPSRRAARPYQSTARTPVTPYRPPGTAYDPPQAEARQSGNRFERPHQQRCQATSLAAFTSALQSLEQAQNIPWMNRKMVCKRHSHV